MARRTTVRGSIVKRERDGQAPFFEVLISRGTDPLTGKRVRETKAFKAEKEAKRYLTARLHEIDRGTAVDPSKLTVAKLMTDWLQTYAAHNVREVTYNSYANTVNTHIIPGIGGVEVQKLTPAQLDRFYSDKLSAGTGTRVVKLIHMRLKQALTKAVEQGVVARNVADAVKPPRDQPKEIKWWSAPQVKRFLETAKDSCYGPVWALSLATGMRKGELMGLAWQDVDFEAGTVTVRQTVGIHRNGSPYISQPKTRSSRRTIHVPAPVMAMLREHRNGQLERKMALGPEWRNEHDLVFTAEMGSIIGPRNLSRECDRLMAKADVLRICVHAQRHAHVSLLLLNRASVKAVSDRVGHSSVGVTLEVYGHLTQEQRKEAADMAEKMLFA